MINILYQDQSTPKDLFRITLSTPVTSTFDRPTTSFMTGHLLNTDRAHCTLQMLQLREAHFLYPLPVHFLYHLGTIR